MAKSRSRSLNVKLRRFSSFCIVENLGITSYYVFDHPDHWLVSVRPMVRGYYVEIKQYSLPKCATLKLRDSRGRWLFNALVRVLNLEDQL